MERNNEKQKQAFNELYDDEKITLLNEYLESVNDFDSTIFPMDDIDEILSGNTPGEIIRLAFNGRRFSTDNENFSPNDDYFIFNGYGNLESVMGYDLDDYLNIYLNEMIDAGYLDHLIDEDEDDDEEDDAGGEDDEEDC